MKAIDVIAKIGKVILAVVLGLFTSFMIVVLLDAILRDGNPFEKESLNIWAVGGVVIVCEALFLWLALRNWSGGPIHTANTEHLPGSVAELIDAIIEAMGYRRSARAEVQQELADHFTDALADCETEQEKQACIKELIAEFGDAKLLGILLRRGKKRCRPMWQKALSSLRQAAWISVVLLIVYIGWFFTGKPEISTNYLAVINEQARPAADDSLNAWPYYEQAYQSLVDCNDKEFDSYPRLLSTLSETDRQTLSKWINDNSNSLELVIEGNQKPYCWRQYDCGEDESSELMSMLMPGLADIRKLSYLLCWQAYLDAEEGQFEAAWNNIFASYSLGQHIRGEYTTLIEQLVAISVENTSTNTLRILLDEYGDDITAEQLDSARTRFADMTENSQYIITFESEKLFLYDEAQRCFTRSRFGKSHLYLPRLEAHDFSIDEEYELYVKRGLQILFTHPGKEETLRQVEDFYAEMERLSNMTPATARSQRVDMDQYIEENIMEKNIFLSILVPALSRIVKISHRSQTDTEATLTALAIKQYEKQFGKLPERLVNLVEKGLLKTVPIDPFSDQPLVYRKTDDVFTLYSVGYNFTDDGGTPGTYEGTNKNPNAKIWVDTGDAVFWPVFSVNSQQ